MGRYWVGSPGPGSAGECVTVLHVNWGFVNSVLTSHEIELQPNLDGNRFVWVRIRSVFSLLLIIFLFIIKYHIRKCFCKFKNYKSNSFLIFLACIVVVVGVVINAGCDWEYSTGMRPIEARCCTINTSADHCDWPHKSWGLLFSWKLVFTIDYTYICLVYSRCRHYNSIWDIFIPTLLLFLKLFVSLD